MGKHALAGVDNDPRQVDEWDSVCQFRSVDELIAAEEMMLDCDLQPCRRAGKLERMEERIKTGIEQMGQRLQTVEKEW